MSSVPESKYNGTYLKGVCTDAIGVASCCKLQFDGGTGLRLDSDRAIPLALIVNELVTNAAKYAFPDRADGRIWVRLVQHSASTVLVSVDDGVDLPANFGLRNSKGLGMRIVAALSEQLGLSITQHAYDVGKEIHSVDASRVTARGAATPVVQILSPKTTS